MRVVSHRYVDPLDCIWEETAQRIGFSIVRVPDAYASTDGRGTIFVGSADTLDADDSLAQMIFHELCHALVEGPEALRKADWGLDNQSDRDVPREHACLRLQAALAQRHGLRGFLAPTTDFREFYDRLPRDPLWPPGEFSVQAARAGLERAEQAPWAPHLASALRATAEIARAVGPYRSAGDLWGTVREGHPFGFPSHADADKTCGGCVWRYQSGKKARCRQAEGAVVDPAWHACERWEGALDCQSCGACCREAYGSVTIPRRDPVVTRHPELVVVRATYLELARSGSHCAALTGEGPYSCSIYEDRPKPCRDFAVAGKHCLTARARVGLEYPR